MEQFHIERFFEIASIHHHIRLKIKTEGLRDVIILILDIEVRCLYIQRMPKMQLRDRSK